MSTEPREQRDGSPSICIGIQSQSFLWLWLPAISSLVSLTPQKWSPTKIHLNDNVTITNNRPWSMQACTHTSLTYWQTHSHMVFTWRNSVLRSHEKCTFLSLLNLTWKDYTIIPSIINALDFLPRAGMLLRWPVPALATPPSSSSWSVERIWWDKRDILN